jgi:hypothetical protein
MARKRGDEHLVPALESRQDRSPRVGTKSEGVKEKKGLSRATTMSDGRAGDHEVCFRKTGIISIVPPLTHCG